MHLKFRYIILVVVVVAVVGGGWWLLSPRAQAATPTTLTASGSIEAVQINVASETGGQALRTCSPKKAIELRPDSR